jgi:hypothetical protein
MLTRVGWVVAGVAVVALFVVLAIRLPGAGATAPTPQPAGAAPPFAGRPAPDISNMTPRERADSLFNRIMREYESGNQSRVEFFRPMALQAYALLGTLDADARYHVGLIHTIGSDLAAARAQVDTIHGQSPNHLMGYMLQAAVARLQSDQPSLQDAYRGFLAAYSSEIAADRREYTEHGQAIEAFRAEARQATGGGA